MDRRDAIKRILGGAAIVAAKQLPEGVVDDGDALDALADLIAEKVAGKMEQTESRKDIDQDVPVLYLPISATSEDYLQAQRLLRNLQPGDAMTLPSDWRFEIVSRTSDTLDGWTATETPGVYIKDIWVD